MNIFSVDEIVYNLFGLVDHYLLFISLSRVNKRCHRLSKNFSFLVEKFHRTEWEEYRYNLLLGTNSLHGYKEEYHFQGKFYHRSNFVNDVLDGLSEKWYLGDEGYVLYNRERYRMGKRHGECAYNFGNLLINYEDNKELERREFFGGEIFYHEKDNMSTFYHRGNVKEKTINYGGGRTRTMLFYCNGQIKKDYHKIDHRLDGPYRFYFRDGSLRSDRFYVNGKLESEKRYSKGKIDKIFRDF